MVRKNWKRGTVNNSPAIIDLEDRTYIPIPDEARVSETAKGEMFISVKSGRRYPDVVRLADTDRASIERSDPDHGSL